MSQSRDRGHVFVAMPFSADFLEVYNAAIKPAIEESGYRSLRADEISRPGNISEDILKQLKNARAVIVDCTGSNPNVMYELGLGHAYKRYKTILISQDSENSVPFNIKPFRFIRYRPALGEATRLKKKLGKFIKSVESEPSGLMGDTGRDLGEVLLKPVDCFTSLTGRLRSLIDSKAEDEVVKLVRALPAEMTHEAFKDQLGDASECVKEYESLIKKYIDERDLDDETVFGCPPNITCLRETLSQIKRAYFTYPGQRETYLKEISAVGFHPYLSSYSLFLMAKLNKFPRRDDGPQPLHTGFIFFLDKHGVPTEGICTSEERGLRLLSHLWGMLVEELQRLEEGVDFLKERTYLLTEGNHDSLFKERIGVPMVEFFGKAHNYEIDINVSQNGDEVTITGL